MLTLSVVSLLSVATIASKENNESPILVEGIDNIEIRKSTVSNDGNTVVVDYTIKPTAISYVNFNTELTWQSENNALFESADWHDGKNTEDYIDYTINQTDRKITFNCLNPFGRQMVFSMSSPYNSNVKASLTIDYKRRQVEGADAVFSSTSLKDDTALSIEKVMPVYSIGSIGERPQDDFSLDVAYVEGIKTTFSSLIDEISTAGIYTQTFIYEDTTYTDTSLLRNAIMNRTKEYLFSLFSLDSPKTFKLSELESKLSYKYAAYSMAGKTVYLTNSSLYRYFLTKYKTNYDSGNALKLTVKYGLLKVKESLIDIEVNDTELTDIEIDDSGIVFNN